MDQGFNYESDLDTLQTEFEKMSLIVIQRHKGHLIFSGNRFTNNIGLFGGAILIDSPDNHAPSNALSYIIVQDNYFKSNMAYISGNSIYIRLTKRSD